MTSVRHWLAHSSDHALAAFRIVLGFLFLCHGTTSLWSWPAEPYGGTTAQLGAWPGWWGAVIQVVCGFTLLLGFGTRLAAFLGSGSMAYAYFWGHQGDGALPIHNDGESAALFCWALFVLIFLGEGSWSVDRVLLDRRDAAASGNRRMAGADTHAFVQA
ncbi:DoxX family protein [Rhodococcus sp. 2H158]